MTDALPISVVIVTYRREQVLVDTLRDLLALSPPPAELIVIDQTEAHEPATTARLAALATAGAIRWVRLDRPSIPHAMNRGLLAAGHELVLFVDDDVRPEPDLLRAHIAAHRQHPGVLVAGRVIQPWQEGVDFSDDPDARLAGVRPAWIADFIGCNFSVGRNVAIGLGGFDENFVRVAYNYETEFAHRLRKSGRKIFFEPAACLHHLKDGGGGTRTFGNHLTTASPGHAVGAYYCCLRTWDGLASLKKFAGRPIAAVATRHHLRHPWWMPATLLAEVRGMAWALALHLRGPRLLVSSTRGADA